MQESCIKCGIPGGIKFSSQVGKVGSHHLRRDPAIPTWDPGWDCRDPAYIPPDILPGDCCSSAKLKVVFSLRQICFIFCFPFTNIVTKGKTLKIILTCCVQIWDAFQKWALILNPLHPNIILYKYIYICIYIYVYVYIYMYIIIILLILLY